MPFACVHCWLISQESLNVQTLIGKFNDLKLQESRGFLLTLRETYKNLQLVKLFDKFSNVLHKS